MNQKSIKRILLVEDNPGDARLLREMFNEEGAYDTELTLVVACTTPSRISRSTSRHHSARSRLARCRRAWTRVGGPVRRAPRVPLVVLTGRDEESLAGQALQEGAQDYLIKGQIDTRGLLRALRYAIERKTMEEALFVEKERAQVTLNSIGDAVVCTDIPAISLFSISWRKKSRDGPGRRPRAAPWQTCSEPWMPRRASLLRIPMEMAIGSRSSRASAVELHPYPARRI